MGPCARALYSRGVSISKKQYAPFMTRCAALIARQRCFSTAYTSSASSHFAQELQFCADTVSSSLDRSLSRRSRAR